MTKNNNQSQPVKKVDSVLTTRASQELCTQVEQELNRPDATQEKTIAILSGQVDDEGDEEQDSENPR